MPPLAGQYRQNRGMPRNRNTQETTVLPASGAWQQGASVPALGLGQGPTGQTDPLRPRPYGGEAMSQSMGQPVHGHQPEEVIVRVRRHGRRLTLPVIVLFVVAGLSGFFVGSFAETWENLLALGIALAIVAFVVVGPLLSWLARRSVITTRRVIMHHGFFVRHRSEISLARVREVRSRQNPVQRMFGSGDIDLYVGGETIKLSDVAGVKLVHAALQELFEQNYDQQVRAEHMRAEQARADQARGSFFTD